MINTMNHEGKHMPFVDKPVIWTPSFLSGYRAFVYGGRDRTYDESGKVLTASGGIEPYDHLSDKQKKEWRKGIEYAIDERNDCRSESISKGSKIAKPKEFYQSKFEDRKILYKQKPNMYNSWYAKELDVSITTISKYKRRINNN